MSIAFKRRHVIEFCLGLYQSRTGKYKLGRSRLPHRIQEFLLGIFKDGHLTELLMTKYGFAAWLRQECAFGNGDTPDAFGALCKERIFGRNVT